MLLLEKELTVVISISARIMKRLFRSSDSDDSGGETDCDRSEQRGTRQKDKKRQKSRSRTSARKGKAPAPPSNSFFILNTFIQVFFFSRITIAH